jgi:hypothetical protein
MWIAQKMMTAIENSELIPQLGLTISDKKVFRGRRNDGTIGLFRRNSGCSAEHKTLGIPFRTIPQKRRMLGSKYKQTLGIPF